nr:hypothetical protein Iba_chr03eCG8480 [Ipomoea batatas]GME19163.1 hypothetical protein Iba_scaffold22050CG0940 [Ipomoea batatas]
MYHYIYFSQCHGRQQVNFRTLFLVLHNQLHTDYHIKLLKD